MGTIAKKLEYLWGTKQRIALAIRSKGVLVSPEAPFIDYADKILDIYENHTGYWFPDSSPGDDTVQGKLSYLEETKERIRYALFLKGVVVPNGTPFRDYPNYIRQIVNTGSGLMDYNGVVLPDVSPHINDTYPKAAILRVAGSVYYQLVVIGGEWEFVQDGEYVSTSPESISITYQAKEGDSSWTKISEDNYTHTGTVELVSVLNSVLWSNFDIPGVDTDEGEGGEGGGGTGGNEGGGYLYGHVAKEGEIPTHTIDGVGYVGVVLPNIDKLWTDKETYPYAVLFYGLNSGLVRLSFGSGAPYYGEYNDFNGVWFRGTIASYALVDGVWEGAASTNTDMRRLIWSSHSIPNEFDGGIYFYAYDPIQVYE